VLLAEADPIEGVSVGIVYLVEVVEQVELLEVFGREELLLLGGFEERKGETFKDLLLELLLVN